MACTSGRSTSEQLDELWVLLVTRMDRLRPTGESLRSRGGRHGFTAVECLIVAGLLLVLAVLLFPLLTEGRRRVQETACIGQLRQFGKAMQLYLEDFESRPPFLHDLHPSYASTRELFTCPADAWREEGGWAWSAWGQFSTPLRHWPYPVSYGYFFTASPQDRRWEQAQRAPGRPGYLVCVVHGKPLRQRRESGTAPDFTGRTLRLCFDGSVVVRDVHTNGFHAWKLMTDQNLPPDLPPSVGATHQ